MAGTGARTAAARLAGALAGLLASLAAAMAQPDAGSQGDAAIARGRYIFHAGACDSCHTDHPQDGAFLAGGRELRTHLGTFYVPNITPDPETGIGGWSFEDFRRAYEPDGLTVDEFDSFGPTARTLRSFISSYHDLQATIRDMMIPDPDVKQK